MSLLGQPSTVTSLFYRGRIRWLSKRAFRRLLLSTLLVLQISTPTVPWLKDVPVAVADPIEPVNKHDVRPSVKDLIVKHRESIDKAKDIIEKHSLFVPQKHDDLWILRFCLSQKKTKNIVKAAQHALEFRQEYNLDETDIRFLPTSQGYNGSSGCLSSMDRAFFGRCSTVDNS